MKQRPAAAAAKKPTASTKRRVSAGTAGRRPRKRARDGSCDGPDLISDLPNDILGTIVSLLPTKDGARTQAVARSWRTAPLNIDAGSLDSRYAPAPRRRGPRRRATSIISRILSDHPGPIRRFDFRIDSIRATRKRYHQDVAHVESWLRSGRLGNLEEFHIVFPFLSLPYHDHPELYPMPSSVLRLASTVVAATIGYGDFPDEIAPPPLGFPLLKHLTLTRVSMCDDIFRGVLSACHVLESLLLEKNNGGGSLHLSSPTLRSIGFRDFYIGDAELVIKDTPHLERLLCINSFVDNIRVNRAPKLEILGPLSLFDSNIQIEKLVFQAGLVVPTSLDHSLCTVKVLALQFSGTDLDAVLDILRFFPCLETLYVMWDKYVAAKTKKVQHYDPADPVKCLQTHLKKLVLKNYKGDEQDVSFAKFFVSNAKVLNEFKFGVNKKIDKKWVANQHSLLGMETEASPDAEFEFIPGSSFSDELDTHDLSIADPFNNLFVYGVDSMSEKARSSDWSC